MAKKDKQDDIEVNVENEQVILASLMKSGKLRKKYINQLEEKDFIANRHKIILRGLKLMYKRKYAYNEDTLNQLIFNEDFGGIKYLREIEELFEKNINLEFHINVLKEDKIKYKLLRNELKKLNQGILNPQVSLANLAVLAEKLKTVALKGAKEDLDQDFREIYINELKSRINKPNFKPTYLVNLDNFLTEGLAKKQLSVICGRPSMGKTTFVVNLVCSLILNGNKVLLCPLENTVTLLLDLMVANLTKIPSLDLIKNFKDLDKAQKIQVSNMIKKIFNSNNFFPCDQAFLTVDELYLLLSKKNYDVCILDAFENLKDVEIDNKSISNKLRDLQQIAKDTDTHILITAQIRRGLEKETIKRPTLEMLKNSGAYEEKADLIIGLHREKYFSPEIDDDILELIILKQRRGSANKIIKFRFEPVISKIDKFIDKDLEDDDED